MVDGTDKGSPRPALMLAALGVVFGDIGTSPLYALKIVFEPSAIRPVPVDHDAIFGVISLVFWSITIIVTVLYVGLITSRDNDGDGGLLALVALLRPRQMSGTTLKVFFALGVFGAALFFSDGLITPAISVLSAVEGLGIIDPGLHDVVVPAALGILAVLIVIQRRGTGRVGQLFGPVMAVWFTTIAVLGVPEIVRSPQILQALSPVWAARFVVHDPPTAFLALGGIVLVVTGGEALYADIGHFGRRPIGLSWLVIVFPALILDYLGQGALLVRDPSAVTHPFFLLAPSWARVPLVILATFATVIASQAVISGAFSVAHQAARLGYLPRLRVIHTSRSQAKQVYVPVVNALIGVGVLALVVGFRSSDRLAAAYGLAVTGTIMISTALFFVVQWQRQAWPRWRIIVASGFFLTVTGVLLAANAFKIPSGGWLPVGLAVVFFVLLTTWHRGQQLTERARDGVEGSLREFVRDVREHRSEIRRVAGCAVFMSRKPTSTPLALRANVLHNHALHETTILLTIQTDDIPHVARADQARPDDLGFGDDGISHVSARLGYLDHPNLCVVLEDAVEAGLEGNDADMNDATFFFSVPELVITDAPGMARWRKHVYVSMERLSPDPVEFFSIPRRQAIEMGAEVEI